MDTNRLGAIAEANILTAAVELGVDVARPVLDGLRYDLIFDLHPTLVRVQCKWVLRNGGVVDVRARTCRRGPNGSYVRGTYSAREVDAVGAYFAELGKVYLLPIEMFAGKQQISLRLSYARNNQQSGIHWAEQYELGAIAQLGERRRGTAEVVGSSPTSSTIFREAA